MINKVLEITGNDGLLKNTQTKIKEESHSYFSSLYTEEGYEDGVVITDLMSIICKIITEVEHKVLLKKLGDQEILPAIMTMESDKSPSSYVFTIHFYKDCWSLIKHDLWRMINHSMRKKNLGGTTNSSFLVLIP